VQKDSPKPDISSVDAFRRTLLAAKTVSWSDPARGGAAGIYMAHLMEHLGISAEINSKIKLDPTGGLLLYQMVANGDTDIGFDQISIILRQSTVQFLGSLPEPIQYYTKFAAGLGATTDQADISRGLIKFLASPSAQARMKANGFN
jgi:molybdate transport system substrate-binding protein